MARIAPPIPFTGNPLDRASEKRSDPAWLAAKRQEAGAVVLPLWNFQPLISEGGGLAHAKLAFVPAALPLPDGNEVFLGIGEDRAYFARDVSAASEADELRLPGRFREARAAAPLLSSPEIAMLGQAKALLEWHARSRFCSTCGAPAELRDGGYRRTCTGCAADHFPRTDPVVIMLVTDGDRCLLARNRRFATTNIYSTLAGYIEPGEGIEDAVRREVFEEVGVRTGAVQFVAAQPWPFPFSLMIGCYAQAESRDIAVDGQEIIAARWFDRAEIRDLIAGGGNGEVGLPRREAIAFHLIRGWIES